MLTDSPPFPLEVAMSFLVLASAAALLAAGLAPEKRALAFLAAEVPRWSRENKCFSCHNNGDGARALMAAHRLGDRLPAGVLDDTLDWLKRPKRWDHNGGEGPFNDKIL